MDNGKKKVLLITPLPPPVHGSSMVSQYIKDSELLNREFEMDFVNLSTSRAMAEIGKKSKILYLKKACRFVASYLKTLWKLMTKRYDVCYLAITCHGVGFLKDMPFVLLCKLFGRKVMIHQHNKGMNSDIDKKPYSWLLPLVYKNTKVILLSWRLFYDIDRVVKREQVLICPNGLPSVKDIGQNRRISNVPKLLFLSNLIESKGVFVLLEACSILINKGLKIECDYIGGETDEISRNDFESKIKEYGLSDYVRFDGPKYGWEKELYLTDADIFVFPTFYHNECLPLVLIEAMQHRLACVSTDEAAIPDIIKDGVTGFICKKNNAEDLAAKLESIIINPEMCVEMGAQGFERYKRKFTLECFELSMYKCIMETI